MAVDRRKHFRSKRLSPYTRRLQFASQLPREMDLFNFTISLIGLQCDAIAVESDPTVACPGVIRLLPGLDPDIVLPDPTL